MVQLLLEAGATVDAQDSYGRTPLSLAAEGGHEAMVRLLLKGGAKVDNQDSKSQTPLSLAAERGHYAV
jgi:ankyrin repeat protein